MTQLFLNDIETFIGTTAVDAMRGDKVKVGEEWKTVLNIFIIDDQRKAVLGEPTKKK